MAAGARADDKVSVAGCDGSDEAGQVRDDVAAVAVHEDEDGAGGERRIETRFAGGTIAAGEVMTRAPAAAAISPVPSVEPLSTTMHSAIRGQGIEATTWPMDSLSLSCRDDDGDLAAHEGMVSEAGELRLSRTIGQRRRAMSSKKAIRIPA